MIRNHKWCVVLWAMLSPVQCQSTRTLQTELEVKSQQVGLALLLEYGNKVCLWSFVGSPFCLKVNYLSRPTATPDGKRIVWVTEGFPYQSVIQERAIDGTSVMNQRSFPFWPDVLALSLSQTEKWAFISNSTELRYGDVHDLSTHVIEGLGPFSKSAGWNVDGTKLVFGRRGKILTFDLHNNHLTDIDSGTDPTWSPDGRWIAYRTETNQAILYDSRSLQRRHILQNHELAPLPLRWSPDSQYLAYVDRKDITQWQLSVLKVEDNATIALTPFNPIIGYITNWSWIVDYKKFCRECVPQ